MSGLIFSIADRQPHEVQSRAVAAVNLQRERVREQVQRVKLAGVMPDVEYREGYPSLDAWYRAQPVKAGRVRPKLVLNADEKRICGLQPSAKLVDLCGLGGEVDHWSIAVFPVMHGYVVGVKAPAGGGGAGVLFRKSYKASDYAMRLSVEHGLPIEERYA